MQSSALNKLSGSKTKVIVVDLNKLKEELVIAKMYRRLAIARGEFIEFAQLDRMVEKLVEQIEELEKGK